MPLQNLFLDADSLRIGANQILTQSNAVYVGNNLHVGNTLILGVAAGNTQWPIPSFGGTGNKLLIQANSATPFWGSGTIDLRVGSIGGRVGMTFSSNVNSGSDFGYIYYYDSVAGYSAGAGAGENSLLLIGVQNDGSATASNEDIVAIENPGNIFINPGMGTDQRAGATSWTNTAGNLWIGNNSVKYLAIHEGLQANVTLRAPITFANSANALVFSGASNTSITLRTSPNGILSFDGGAGSLLSISNNILGQIFSVNDISGFPVIEVTANTVPSNTMVQMGQFGSRVTIGTNVTPNSSLTITGNSTISAIDIQHAATPQSLGYLRTPSGTRLTYNSTNELVLLNLSQLRFTDGAGFNYDNWGGIRYVTANNTMIIGGPGAPGITNNTVVAANIVMHNATTGNFMVANSTATGLFVGANNNVGIGNSTPASPIVVERGADSNNPLAAFRNTTGGTGSVASATWKSDTVGGQLDIGVASNTYAGYGLIAANGAFILSKSVNGLGIFADDASSYIRFGAGGLTEHVRLVANGNLGVGNTTPAQKLRVEGTASFLTSAAVGANVIANTTAVFIGNSTVNTVITQTTASFNANSTITSLFVAANGNVGVGNASPNAKLLVTGTANVSGNVVLGGDLTVSGNISGTAANVQIVAGSFTTTFANTGAVTFPGSVNATSYTVGSNFVANTLGVYHTGTINAASFTTTNIIANTSGVYPLSNSAGIALGSTTQRWALTANSGTFSGDVTIAGNLTTSGTTTYINTTNLNVGDNIITLNADLGAVAPTENAGIEINRGSSANVQFIWDETNDWWAYSNTNITGYANVSTSVNTALLTVGTSFIANTTGAYHTGTINATSLSVGTNFVANAAGINHTGTINAASHTVGTAFIANSTGVTTTGFANISTTMSVGANVVANTTAILVGNSTINTSITSTKVATSFLQNRDTIAVNETIGTGFNAMSVGPVTINSGVTVTVNAGQRWVVL